MFRIIKKWRDWPTNQTILAWTGLYRIIYKGCQIWFIYCTYCVKIGHWLTAMFESTDNKVMKIVLNKFIIKMFRNVVYEIEIPVSILLYFIWNWIVRFPHAYSSLAPTFSLLFYTSAVGDKKHTSCIFILFSIIYSD